MNPSVGEILEAVQDVDAERVIFLPNNRNIVPAARQAADLFERPLSVVETSTIPEGVAAMFAFNPEVHAEENVSGDGAGHPDCPQWRDLQVGAVGDPQRRHGE